MSIKFTKIRVFSVLWLVAMIITTIQLWIHVPAMQQLLSIAGIIILIIAALVITSCAVAALMIWICHDR